MPIVIAYDEARANQRVTKSRFNDTDVKIVETPFLGERGNPDLPLVILAAFDPGRYSSPHYHDTDQFQVMTAGKGKLGRHNIATNSIHFARANTPYGPFVADAEAGLTCLIIRAHPDSGSQHSDEAMARLIRMPDRRPWQVTSHASFPAMDAADVLLRPIAGIENPEGLAAHTLGMKPGAAAFTDEPDHGDGLFVVVLKGSLLHDGKESRGLALVYLSPREEKFQICAGPDGLEGLVLQFPKPRVLP